MIISASRRTDIPAFYGEWFARRLREGFCEVPNPVRPSQVSRVSLRADDVDVIAFWTRNARPFFPVVEDLERRGYRFYFLYTLMNNPPALDPGMAPLAERLATFRELAARVGPQRVIWRYDPVVLSAATGVEFHREQFSAIAGALNGSTRRCIISFLDLYSKVRRRLEQQKVEIEPPGPAQLEQMVPFLESAARDNGIEVQSCAEERDLAPLGIPRGKCIDDAYIRRTFGIEVTRRKDPAQRPACGCVTSRDIGMYGTCPAGCLYCYATTDPAASRRAHAEHDPTRASLV